jgi:3-oxoacyl-[acyl-carrier protein] reductase
VDTKTERRVALVNGAGNSLGREVALELSGAGFALALFDRPQLHAAVRALEAEVRQTGGEAVLIEGAGTDEVPVRVAREAYGRLDCLVNLLVPAPEIDPDQLYRAPMAFLAGGLAAMESLAATAPGSAIVNHCFMPGAFVGTQFEDCMPAVKGAMTGITRTLCRRLGARAVTVNCIQTGLIEIPELRAQASGKVLQQKVPVGRWGKPADVAKLVGFLATRNRYWTGQSIIVDGGLTSGITGT